MTVKRSFFALALVLSIVVSIAAQSTDSRSSAKAEEAKKAQEELKRKALGMIEEVIKEAQAMRIPENRLRIQIAAANPLWPLDEGRAVGLFKDAVSSYGELVSAIQSGDPKYANLLHMPIQLRQEMAQVAGQHNAKLALDFLRSTRNPATPQLQAYYNQTNLEAQLQIRLAVQAANKNLTEALAMAEESLSLGIDQETVSFLYTLQSKDKEAAIRFQSDVVKKLRAEDFTKNPAAFYAAFSLVGNWINNNRAAGNGADLAVQGDSLPPLDRRAALDLTGILVNAAISIELNNSYNRYDGMGRSWLGQLQPILPDIEKLAPAQAPALRQRMAELEKLNGAQNNPWLKYQELINNGTSEALIEATRDAPSEMQGHLYQQAAWKALNQGDSERAREIVRDKIVDPNQRRDMMANIDRQMMGQAYEQGRFDEVRSLLSRIPSLEERTTSLCLYAANAIEKGDKATALQFLNEAQAMVNQRAQNYSELQAQLQVAGALGAVDLPKGMAMIESAVARVNELAAAASVLNGFDIQEYFRDGEFLLNSGNSMTTVVQQVCEHLGSLSKKDFDRARLVAERFERVEMRVKAFLSIAQSTLQNDGTGNEGRSAIILTSLSAKHAIRVSR